MSHFTLLVLSESPAHVDNQMEPFSESPSEEYIRFVPATETREELEKVYREMKERFRYKSFDEYMREYYGYTLCDASKTYGHYTNPDGKWDWYVQGGRWTGLLTLRPEAAKEYPPLVIEGKAYPGRANQARLRDIDFSPDADAYARTLRFWEVNVEGMPLREDEKEDSFLCLYKPEYYLEQYGSKEEFAQSESAFTTWALLTPEGEWHEKGAMGWFGMSNSTRESRQAYEKLYREILEQADPALYATILDCHT